MKYLPALFILLPLNLFSQNVAVFGKVLDTLSHPIESVAVKLYEVTPNQTEQFLKGTTTNSNGEFNFEDLNSGTYLLEFIHINYTYYAFETIIPQNTNQYLGDIFLVEKLNALDEIIISGKKFPVKHTADKVTINVESNVLSTGGTPLDILKQIPIVSMSAEGVISVKGKNDIQILIDGKPSGFAAIQGQQFLDQLDLSTISKIEIITNPSVIYSSTGAGGIINIITKKNFKNGYNGQINTGLGSDEWHHLSPSFNYKIGKVNLFFNYTLRNRKRLSKSTNYREQLIENELQFISQEQSGTRNDKRHNIQFGSDLYISENKYITFSGNYRSRNKKDDQKRSSILRNENDVIELRSGIINEPEQNEGWGANIQFKSTGIQNNEMRVLLDYVHSVEDEITKREEFVTTENLSNFIDGIQTFYVDINDRLFLDFEQQKRLKDSSKITYGFQTVYRKINQTFSALAFINDSGIYEPIPDSNDTFNYEDLVSSVYFQTDKKIHKLDIEAAIRLELLRNKFNSESIDENFRDGYFKVFPSIKVNYKFNDNTSIVVSFKKGVNRPAPNRLNPFPDLTNAFNISIGNPELQPEIFYNIETGLNTKIGKTTLTTGLFYTIYKDIIQRITELRDDGLSYRFPVNINKMHHYGIDLSLQVSPIKSWNQQIGYLVYNRIFEDDIIDNSKRISHQIKSTSTITVSDTINFQLFASYTSPENTSQGNIKAIYFADAGLDYSFFNKKVKLSIILNDIFNTFEEETLLLSEGLTVNSNDKINSRRVYFNLKYKF